MMTATTGFQLPIAHNIEDIKSSRNKSESELIPRIIHQIWKNKNLSDYPVKPSYNELKQNLFYKNYTIKLWTDDDLNELIRLHYSFLYQTYKSYKIPIQRADIGRLPILHFQGGIYADLDTYPGGWSVEELRDCQFVAPQANNFHILTNHFLMAQRNSTLLKYLLLKAAEKTKVSIWIHYLHVFWATGPLFMTKMVNESCQLNPNYDGIILDDRFINGGMGLVDHSIN